MNSGSATASTKPALARPRNQRAPHDSSTVAVLLQGRCHLLVVQINSLQWTKHDFEVCNVMIAIPADEVDAIDLDTIDFVIAPKRRPIQ